MESGQERMRRLEGARVVVEAHDGRRAFERVVGARAPRLDLDAGGAAGDPDGDGPGARPRRAPDLTAHAHRGVAWPAPQRSEAQAEVDRFGGGDDAGWHAAGVVWHAHGASRATPGPSPGASLEDVHDCAPWRPCRHRRSRGRTVGLSVDAAGSRSADDPAAAQAETPAQLRTLLADAGADLRKRPEPREWSVLELIGHIVDAEIVSSGRYRWILVHDDADIVPYDQDLWVDRLGHNDQDPAEMLELFEALRRANLQLWARTPAAGRARVGLHRERGPESYDLTFRMIAGHDRFHVTQARTTLASIRADR